ncbi:MAG: diacylglycerol kinase [Candidatus Electrothrix sp. AX5]|jgi:diacylglycerol kinase (ATP)|uniref:Diacylglycerol kinase (ATP) n=1 Tax=Candidatus Electrothrix aarhusensis TaxID=1859131 RepID=A0A3S3QJK3_9BACT|nr:diacylglycerol kinase [Candidatus Electrothrix sp. AX5]RWX46192.1 diacylglycerol kinase (ATP) [Candidatus Electrothrix aarhusensis]
MRNKFLGTGEQGFRPIRKIRVAFSGLRYAVLYDFAVAYKIVLSVVTLAGCFYYRQWLDFGVVFMATGFMLASEMFNTTVEALCDFMEPQKNEKIAIIKDISAAAAGISILVWWVIIGLEAIHVLQYTGYLPSCFS